MLLSVMAGLLVFAFGLFGLGKAITLIRGPRWRVSRSASHFDCAPPGVDGDGGGNPGGREFSVWRFLGRAGTRLVGFLIHFGNCPSYCVGDCGNLAHINYVPGLNRCSGSAGTGGLLWQSYGANYRATPQFFPGAKLSIR